MTEILADLLAPLAVKTFLAEVWGQHACLVPAPQPDRFCHLCSWDDLNHLLNFHRLRSPDLRFTRAGETLADTEPQQWRDRLQQGATLVLNGLHERLPAVAAFAAALQRDLGHRTQVNLYLSPPQQQGFDCHYDTHDVLILQLAGSKAWSIYEPTQRHPLPETRSNAELPPETPPYWQGTLQPGDLLYIPRGHWHYAIATTDCSLHLTVGLASPTGIDWLHWLAAELQAEPRWRQSLPPLLAGDPERCATHLAALQEDLRARLESPDWVARYQRDLQQQQQLPLPLALPDQLPAAPDWSDWSPATRFQVPPPHRARFQTNERGEPQVTLGGKRVAIAGLPEPVLQRLFAPSGCTLWELADCAPDLEVAEIASILAGLVAAGVLHRQLPAEDEA